MRRALIAGNWKMFGRRGDLGELGALQRALGDAAGELDVLICPPTAYLAMAAWAGRDGSVLIGAQDCSAVGADSARTGEVSAGMLAELGARYVIVGHSERRQFHGESDALVRQKAEAAQSAGIVPVICLGETLAERQAGKAGEVVSRQLSGSAPATAGEMVIAYEPVWAIGAAATPSLADISEIHALLRDGLNQRYGAAGEGVRILYGGSVNPSNAADIFSCEDVDGALVGRASLKAADFSAIILAHPAARAA